MGKYVRIKIKDKAIASNPQVLKFVKEAEVRLNVVVGQMFSEFVVFGAARIGGEKK